jgi:hypothetical protein
MRRGASTIEESPDTGNHRRIWNVKALKSVALVLNGKEIATKQVSSGGRTPARSFSRSTLPMA